MSRILAVDYGTKRIGVALSDTSRTLASPLPTLVRRVGKRPPWAELCRLVQENEVEEIVVGLPLGLDGDDSDWTAEVRQFADGLSQRTGRPIVLVDERLSSVRAERMVRGSGLRKREREDKGRIDAAAAAILLQAHLDGRKNIDAQI